MGWASSTLRVAGHALAIVGLAGLAAVTHDALVKAEPVVRIELGAAPTLAGGGPAVPVDAGSSATQAAPNITPDVPPDVTPAEPSSGAGASAEAGATAVAPIEASPAELDPARVIEEIQLLPDGGQMVPIGMREALIAFENDAAVFVDAREAGPYAAGFIPGSINLHASAVSADAPGVAELNDRLGGITSWPVVIYCTGGACDESKLTGQKLIATLGLQNVRIMTEGFADWRDAGHPVMRPAGAGSSGGDGR